MINKNARITALTMLGLLGNNLINLEQLPPFDFNERKNKVSKKRKLENIEKNKLAQKKARRK